MKPWSHGLPLYLHGFLSETLPGQFLWSWLVEFLRYFRNLLIQHKLQWIKYFAVYYKYLLPIPIFDKNYFKTHLSYQLIENLNYKIYCDYMRKIYSNEPFVMNS